MGLAGDSGWIHEYEARMAQFKTMYDEGPINLQSFRSNSSIWTKKSLKDERNLEKSEDLPEM